jgi:hypothetical protein
MWWLAAFVACRSCGPEEVAPPPVPVPAPAPGAPAAAWSAADCVPSELAEEVRDLQPDEQGKRVLRRDLDGDGNVDHVEVSGAAGEVALLVRLSRATQRLRLRYEVAPGLATPVTAPDDWTPEERAIAESVLWPLRCDRPDPALAATLAPDVVTWVSGAPAPAPGYALRRPDGWLVVRDPAPGDDALSPLAADGDLTVSAGPRGVVAVCGGAHAWLAVTR